MRYYLLLLVAFSMYLLISCEDTVTPEPPVSRYIMDLKVGNEWVYTDSIFEDNKVIVEDVIVRITRMDDVEIGSKQYKAFVAVTHDNKNEPIIQEFLSTDSYGLYTYGSENDPFKLKYRNLLIKYPTYTNENWKTIYHYFTNLTHRFSHDTCDVVCLSDKVKMTRPSGEFYSVKYRYTLNNKSFAEEHWISPIGIVDYKLFDTTGNLSRRRILKATNVIQ